MTPNLENSAVATELEKVSFHFNPKERQYQRILKLLHNCTHHTHTSKLMLKILQARLQQYMNHELPDVQAGFRKGIVPTSAGSWKKEEFQKIIYLCLIDYAKAFDFVDHNKLWKILQEMGIPST